MIRILTLMMAGVLFAGVGMAATQEQLAGVEVQAMADTLQYSMENNPTNQSSDWVNPDTKRSGAVTPVRTFENAQGQPCREFITTIIIADQEEQGYGTACRQPDGSWEIVNDADQTQPVAPPVVKAPPVVTPPPVYYAYPSGFWGSYNIFLSFDYVYRSGHRHRGRIYLDGPRFRTRYPITIHRRVDYGPRIIHRYRFYDELKYRNWERRSWPRSDYNRGDRRSKSGWSERRREERGEDKYDDRSKKRGRGHD